MTMSSSSHHHFVLCLFLLSFLCVNSQPPHDVFIVIIKTKLQVWLQDIVL
uniref:Transmembrane protein n=1 Tax=Solanum lycopersicum TaxID=4081 RepID=A0A3Q7I7V3_SOLLC